MIVILLKFGALWTNNRGNNSSHDPEFTVNFADVVKQRCRNFSTAECRMQFNETARDFNGVALIMGFHATPQFKFTL